MERGAKRERRTFSLARSAACFTLFVNRKTMSQSDPPRPSFTIGITGNMDLNFSEVSREELEARLRTLYLFLRYGWKCEEAGAPPVATKAGKAFAELLAYPRIEKDLKPLKEWPGVGPNTEMVLLSSMAPGADTIAARVLLDLSKDERYPNFRARVKVVLPFPEDLYLAHATTFANPDRIANIETYRTFNEEIAAEDRFIAFLDEDLRDNPCRLEESTEAPEHGEAESSLRQQFVVDLEDKASRNRRYQSAGEYLAGFCDLLIAIYDDRSNSGAQAGSNQIVQAKRWGLTPGLLPHSHPNTWADNGPVLHLYHPREKTKTAAKGAPDPGPRAQTPIRLLHPFDLGPKDDETRDRLAEVWTVEDLHADDMHESERLEHAFAEWHTKGNLIAVRIGRNFREFNECPVDETKELDELSKLCGRKLNDDEVSAHLRNLLPIARVRCRAKLGNYPMQDRFKSTLKRLIIYGFVAAVLLHFFSHWHPQFHSHSAETSKEHTLLTHTNSSTTEPSHLHEEKLEEGDHYQKELRYKVIRLLIGLTAMGFAIAGLFEFLNFLKDRVEERRHDYRALSEALRIQFYWGMAGLRRSVASNYMQRIRSEMDWIRNAVSSITFPSERFQSSFLHLSKRNQIKLLRATIAQWIRPPISSEAGSERNSDRQEDYFYSTFQRETSSLQLFHQTGSCIALAGLLQAIWIIFMAANKSAAKIFLAGESGPWGIMGFFLAGIWTVAIALTIGRHERLGHHHPKVSLWSPYSYHRNEKRKRKGTNGRWETIEVSVYDARGFLGDLFSHRHSAREQSNKRRRTRFAIVNFLFALIPAAGIALILNSLIFLLSSISSEFPGPVDLGIVSMGTCLVGGALLIAYAERQLLSEHAFQYRASYAYFASSRLRLEEAIRNLRIALIEINRPSHFLKKGIEEWQRAATTDREPYPDEIHEILARISERGESEFIRHRERIHQLLYALGKEALDENSEWLILHRSRPMEPVMAG